MTPLWRSKSFLVAFFAVSVLAVYSLFYLLTQKPASPHSEVAALPAPAPAPAPQSVFESIGQEVDSVFEKSKAAVVKVRATKDDDYVFVGSGFFVDDQGSILTAAAVVADARQINVEVNGENLEAKLVGQDNRSGIALLQVPVQSNSFLPVGNSAALKTASSVIAIGYPLNLPVAPSFGLVGGFDSRFLDRFFATTHIRANVPISAGQVGGPLLNTRGEVVGLIITAVDHGKSIYALPSLAFEKVLGDLRQYGSVRHGWVGVGVVESPEKNGPHAVKISQLFQETPAAASGLQPGDTVVKIGDRQVHSPADVMDASFFSVVGKELPVTVSRNGKLMTFKFTVSERPTAMPMVAKMPQEPSRSTLPNPSENQAIPVKSSQ